MNKKCEATDSDVEAMREVTTWQQASLNIMDDMERKNKELEASQIAYANILDDMERKNKELETSQIAYANILDDMERKNAELDIARAYADNIIKSMMEMLIIAEPTGTIKSINKAVCRVLGYGEEDLIGRPVQSILVEEKWRAVVASVTRRGFVDQVETNLLTKKGDHMVCLLSASVMGHTNHRGISCVDGIVCVATDISDRKKMENEIRKELKEATVNLVHVERLSALGELAAGVAHELKQPLNVIKLVSQVLLMDKKKGRFKEEQLDESLGDVISQVDRMAEIIDHMRIYTRRSDKPVMEKCSANDRVESACKFFSQQLKNHNIEFVKELASDLPMIQCDSIRLEQVVVNLVTNARNALEKCSKPEKRIVVATHKMDALYSPLGKDSVVVEIRDNAEGIPEAIVQKIFEPFFTTAEPGKGTGLGLSISTKIMEEHGGKIELENKVGAGAAFKIILPACGEVQSSA